MRGSWSIRNKGFLTGAARLMDFGASLRSETFQKRVNAQTLDDWELLCLDGAAIQQDLELATETVFRKLPRTKFVKATALKVAKSEGRSKTASR